MNLHLCIDGVIDNTFPLRDGDDTFNAASERTAIDMAYEAKESNPDAVITLLFDMKVGEASLPDEILAAEACEYLASIDEGEYTDVDSLLAVAKRLRERVQRTVITEDVVRRQDERAAVAEEV